MNKKTSNIPDITVPEFKPSIPDYMVDSIKDKSIKFLVEQVSIIKQQNRWQSEHIAEVYDYTRTINGKVIELEQYRQKQETKYIVSTKIKLKQSKLKKVLLPSIAVFGLFLYPLYINAFLVAGPVSIADIISKILP
jgi:hypothetical protein